MNRETPTSGGGDAGEPPIVGFGPPAEPGEIGTLGPYRLQKVLGQGGMGAVYLAFDPELGRQLAIKLMLPRFAANPKAKERFLREARATASLTHDHIITIFEARELLGMPYIAMPYLKGTSLDGYLKSKGNPRVSQILRIATEAATGLAAAHAAGLIHRDITPGNLWLEAPTGRVKILDFGLSRSVETHVELTNTGDVVGTPAYMSPEQARGDRVDHLTDLFSLGAILYRMATGQLPFPGNSMMAVLTALATDEPKPVRDLNTTVPEPLAQLIHQLLAKPREDRPKTATEVARRLKAITAEAKRASTGELTTLPLNSLVTETQSAVVQLQSIDAPTMSIVEASIAPIVPTKRSRRRPAKRSRRRFLTALACVAIVGVFLTALACVGVFGRLVLKKYYAFADDRKAAEWVLSIGGKVGINNDAKELSSKDELPKTAFTLTAVNLTSNPVTDADLAKLKDLTNLTKLNLNGTKITDAGLAQLANSTKLTTLSLYDLPISDKGLAQLKDLTDLTVLNLSFTKITDVGLAQLANSTKLTELLIGGLPISDQGLAQLKDLTNLTMLYLGGTKITDAGMAQLANSTKLTMLWLTNLPISDQGLAQLKDLTNLTVLNLSFTKITDAGLAQLAKLKKLTRLDLMNTTVTAQGAKDLHAAIPGCEIFYNGGIIQAIK